MASSAMLVLRRQFSGEPIRKSVGCLKNALGRVYSRRPDFTSGTSGRITQPQGRCTHRVYGLNGLSKIA